VWICFRIVDTGASSWLFYFCILILAQYKNENTLVLYTDKGKFVPVHTKKAYRGNIGIDPLSLNIDTIWRRGSDRHPSHFTAEEKTLRAPWIEGEWVWVTVCRFWRQGSLFEPPSRGLLACNLVSTPNEISRLLILQRNHKYWWMYFIPGRLQWPHGLRLLQLV
jgi:hypothetical protein